jgi:hypothetical protein
VIAVNAKVSGDCQGVCDLTDVVLDFERAAPSNGALPAGVRARLEAEMRGMLVDPEPLHAHIRALQARFGREFPPYRLLTRSQLNAALARGLAALDDATLARLYRDPVALYDLHAAVLERLAPRD